MFQKGDSPLPLRILVSQIISLQRARGTDFNFLTHMFNMYTSEFGGYNTRLAREQGHVSKVPTKAVYAPLIDLPPALPTTMLTAMIEAQRLTKEGNHIPFSLMTNNSTVSWG